MMSIEQDSETKGFGKQCSNNCLWKNKLKNNKKIQRNNKDRKQKGLKIKLRRTEFLWLEMNNQTDVPTADCLAHLIPNETSA